MKEKLIICSKFIMFFAFLFASPFPDALKQELSTHRHTLMSLVNDPGILHTPSSIKNSLQLFSVNENLTIEEEPEISKPQPSKEKETVPNGKRIYIYNTHQSEAYSDHKTVLDGAVILASLLEKQGYEVIVEKRSVNEYLNEHNLTYNDSYTASYTFLQDTFQDSTDFDLIIDFHRDSIPREMSVYEKDGIQYAKCMFVVGGSNDNFESIHQFASELHEAIDLQLPGMMRSLMVREIAYYNQHLHDKMVLLEVGSDANSFSEVQASLSVIAKGIDAFLKEAKS